MKKILFLVIPFLFLLSMPVRSAEVDTDFMHGLSPEANQNIKQILPDFSSEDYLDNLSKGNLPFSWEEIGKHLLSLFTKELRSTLNGMGAVMVIALLGSFLKNMSDSFQGSGISTALRFGLMATLSGILIQSFSVAAEAGKTAISHLVELMNFAAPVLGVLSALSGAAATANGMYPVIAIAGNLFGIVMKQWILPLLYLVFIVKMIHYTAGNVRLSHLAKLGTDLVKWLIGIGSTVFLAVLAVSGFSGSSLDGMGGKVMKFAAGSLVPVVGGTLSEALDTVLIGSTVLKNATGILGIVLIFVLLTVPLLKVGACILTFRITAVLTELISEPEISGAVNACSEVLTLMLGGIFLIGMLFVISISALLAAGNAGLAMR